WNYSASFRQTAGASRQSKMPGQALMARLPSKSLAFLWNAPATSAHPPQVPAWNRFTGRTRALSIHKDILAFLLALRLRTINAGRSASRDAPLRSRIFRSKMDVRQISRTAASGQFSVLWMERAFQFVTTPASLHSASD